MGSLEHLEQGKWTSEGHFGFRCAWTPQGEGGVYVGHLGLAIMFVVVVFADASRSPMTKGGIVDLRPGDLQNADSSARERYKPAAVSGTAPPADGPIVGAVENEIPD